MIKINKNNIMKKLSYLFLITISLFVFNSCEEEVKSLDTNYITFAKDAYSTGVDVGSSTTVDVTIYTANIASSDRSFDVSIDESSNAAEGSYSVPTSVTIPGGTNVGTLTISLSDVNLGIGVNNLVLNFTAANGLFTGESTTLSYNQNCTEVTGTLDIVFDGYGNETAWEITDALGGVVASAALETYAEGQASASESITLCAGRDYTFTITDDYGDGLSWPNNGTYTLTIGGSIKAQGGGDFGASESTEFDTK